MSVTVDPDYYVGDQAVLKAQFSDPQQTAAPLDPATGFTLVNPSGVQLVGRWADGTRIVIPVTVAGFVYTGRVALDREGTLWYGWEVSGNYVGYKPGFIQVKPAPTA